MSDLTQNYVSKESLPDIQKILDQQGLEIDQVGVYDLFLSDLGSVKR